MDTVYAMYFSFLQSLKLSRRISHMAMRIFITIYQTDARFSFRKYRMYMFFAVHIEWRKSIYIVALITFKFCKHSDMNSSLKTSRLRQITISMWSSKKNVTSELNKFVKLRGYQRKSHGISY